MSLDTESKRAKGVKKYDILHVTQVSLREKYPLIRCDNIQGQARVEKNNNPQLIVLSSPRGSQSIHTCILLAKTFCALILSVHTIRSGSRKISLLSTLRAREETTHRF